MEKNEGFNLSFSLIKDAVKGIIFGDLMMKCLYRTRPYELEIGTGISGRIIGKVGVPFVEAIRKTATNALKNSRRFTPTTSINDFAELTKPFLSLGNQYGEGWFLAGEMLELINQDVPNIVCIQPFAFLPNHVVGKGIIKRIRSVYPNANIAAVDYDPGASEVNQLNRIKLMLSSAESQM